MSESKTEEPALARWPVFLAGAGFGVLAAYLLDPESGRGRRTQMRDQSSRFGRDAFKVANRRWRGLAHRLHGFYADLTSLVAPATVVDDATLVKRVRSEFGHAIRFAQAVRVDANDGVITLSGPVLDDNVTRLVDCVRAVPGVRQVVDHLDRQSRDAHAHH